MLNIVLFGPPGAGKGTQSEKLISAYQLVHLSTGDILRAEIAGGTDKGMEAKKLMDAGLLVPDEVVIGMISSKLDKNKDAKGFIFDGFPRTTAQAEALDKLLAEKNTSITLMVALDVTDEELTKRLLLRGKDSGRPDDVNEEIINKRIQEYNKKTAPLKDYYSAQNKFESVKGIGSIDEIFESLCSAINFIHSESTADVKPEDESVVSKITNFVKNVFTKNEDKDTAPVKKIASKNVGKKVPARKQETAASRKSPNTPAKRVEERIVKKSPAKKTVKKAAAKKIVVKKIAVKKTSVKKAAGKSKPVKKVAVKKVAAKKTAAKKVAPKKIAAKKIVKKVAAKKPVKKLAAKKTAKKIVSKKAVKKTASRKPAIKKAVKKVVKKTAAKKVVKKVSAKKVAKKITPKKVVKQNKKAASKKVAKRRK